MARPMSMAVKRMANRGWWAKSSGTKPTPSWQPVWHYVYVRGNGYEAMCGTRMASVTSDGEQTRRCKKCTSLLEEVV
jgi:hypothetical protein